MGNLEAGKIVNTHGLRGEVKVVAWTDTPQVFEDIPYVTINRENKIETLNISSIKYQKANLIIKFTEINSIEQAEELKNVVLNVERSILGELPENTYYIADLIGLDVIEEDGNKLGEIVDVFSNGSSDIYEVKRENKKPLLIPVIDEIVLNVNIAEGNVVVRMMEGLDDL